MLMFALSIASTRVVCDIHPMNVSTVVCVNQSVQRCIKPDTEPDAAEWVEFNKNIPSSGQTLQLEKILYQMQIKWKTSKENLRSSSPINQEKGINF